jgi:hypothetical protein
MRNSISVLHGTLARTGAKKTRRKKLKPTKRVSTINAISKSPPGKDQNITLRAHTSIKPRFTRLTATSVTG